jgi:hypothetical protein
LPTAISESQFHTERFYRATNESSADIDMRVYTARIGGSFDDLLNLASGDARLDPDSYAASQDHARRISDADELDGVVYQSVRDHQHRPAVACLRPAAVRNCHSHSYLLYRWDGIAGKIVDIVKREALGFD